MRSFDPTPAAAQVAMALLGAALILAVVRLIRGPSLPDRVVALDLIAIVMVGLMATDTVLTGDTLPLQAAVVVALLAFLSTIAFARYLEKRGRR
jgi:multicomponent Na+:H+ antiporter subunit F